MARRNAGVLGSGPRYVLTVLLGMSASMVVAYGMVRVMTKDTVFAPDADAGAVDRAWTLRACANELTRLANAFSDAAPSPAAPLSPGTRLWLRQSFQDEVTTLQRELAGDRLAGEAPTRELLAACARLSSMALHSDDAALRRVAYDDIRRALGAVESYIAEKRLQRRIALPVTPLR